MTDSVLKDHVDSIGHMVHEYQSTNDQRLTSLEKKGSVDPLVTEKLNRLDGVLDQAERKMAMLETAFKRPLVGGGSDFGGTESREHKAAFMDYVRQGSENALLLNTKSLNATGNGGQEGGYMVPQVLSEHMYSILNEASFFRSIARVTSISSDALDCLIDAGQMGVGWVQETEAHDETEVVAPLKKKIAVHELYARPRATQRLLDDATVNVEQWLSERIASQMASKETEAFITGDGNNKPTGFLHYNLGNNWGEIEAVNTGADGAFHEDNPSTCLVDLFHRLKPQYFSNAVWVMSRAAQAEVRKLKDPNNLFYLWQPSLSAETPATLMGHPVHTTDHMPALNVEDKACAIAFGNFKEGYQIVDRQQIHVLRDPFSQKPYVEFYTTKRVGGDVVNFEAIKVLNFKA